MKRAWVTPLVALVATAGLAVSSAAQTPTPSWPPGKAQVFISAQTWTAPSSYGDVPAALDKQENFFQQGAGVHFFVTAVDLKIGKVLTGKDVKYAYVTIPGQPNLKLTWGKHGTAATAPVAFMATWSIPPDYQVGVVPFRILFKTKAKRYGSFEQVPVAAAQLTVLKKA